MICRQHQFEKRFAYLKELKCLIDAFCHVRSSKSELHLLSGDFKSLLVKIVARSNKDPIAIDANRRLLAPKCKSSLRYCHSGRLAEIIDDIGVTSPTGEFDDGTIHVGVILKSKNIRKTHQQNVPLRLP